MKNERQVELALSGCLSPFDCKMMVKAEMETIFMLNVDKNVFITHEMKCPVVTIDCIYCMKLVIFLKVHED